LYISKIAKYLAKTPNEDLWDPRDGKAMALLQHLISKSST